MIVRLLRRVGLAGVWFAVLVASGAALWWLPSAATELVDIATVDWWRDAQPDEVAVLAVRVVAGIWWVRSAAATAYLLVATAIGAPAHARRAAALLPTVGRRLMRPVATGVVAVSLVATSTPVMAQSGDVTQPEPTTVAAEEAELEPLVMSLVPDAQWPDYDYPTTNADLGLNLTDTEPTTSDPTTSEPAAEPVAAASDGIWVVERGDHLWRIAAQTAPADSSDREIAAHWLNIIELNRAALPDPANPDLIYPGMRVKLP
jgi:hypothetical protein